MSRTFVGASSQRLDKTLAASLAMPCSMGAWVNVTTFNFTGLMSVGNAGTTYFSIVQSDNVSPGGWNLETSVSGVTATSDAITAKLTSGTWVHLLGVWTNATSRAIYQNGVKTTSATSSSPSGTLTTATLGANRFTASSYSYLTGQVAFAGIWKVALSDNDALELAAGKHPVRVQSAQLVACPELNGENSPESDLVSNTPWTLTAAPTQSANPRIYARV